jgi:hypothetical protein
MQESFNARKFCVAGREDILVARVPLVEKHFKVTDSVLK